MCENKNPKKREAQPIEQSQPKMLKRPDRPPLSAMSAQPYMGMGVEETSFGGLVVQEVSPWGPASKAGLRPGDSVINVGGSMVSDLPNFTAALLRHGRPGNPLTMEVLQGGARKVVTLHTTEQPGTTRYVRDLPPTATSADLAAVVGHPALLDQVAGAMFADLSQGNPAVVTRAGFVEGIRAWMAPGYLNFISDEHLLETFDSVDTSHSGRVYQIPFISVVDRLLRWMVGHDYQYRMLPHSALLANPDPVSTPTPATSLSTLPVLPCSCCSTLVTGTAAPVPGMTPLRASPMTIGIAASTIGGLATPRKNMNSQQGETTPASDKDKKSLFGTAHLPMLPPSHDQPHLIFIKAMVAAVPRLACLDSCKKLAAYMPNEATICVADGTPVYTITRRAVLSEDSHDLASASDNSPVLAVRKSRTGDIRVVGENGGHIFTIHPQPRPPVTQGAAGLVAALTGPNLTKGWEAYTEGGLPVATMRGNMLTWNRTAGAVENRQETVLWFALGVLLNKLLLPRAVVWAPSDPALQRSLPTDPEPQPLTSDRYYEDPLLNTSSVAANMSSSVLNTSASYPFSPSPLALNSSSVSFPPYTPFTAVFSPYTSSAFLPPSTNTLATPQAVKVGSSYLPPLSSAVASSSIAAGYTFPPTVGQYDSTASSIWASSVYPPTAAAAASPFRTLN